MGRTHLTTGVTAGALGAAVMPWIGGPDLLAQTLFVVVTAYSALLPDLDHHSSTVTYSLGPVTILASWLLRGCPIEIYFWRWEIEARLAPWTVTHRGVTHDVRYGPAGFALVLGPPTWLLPGWFGDHWWLWTLGILLGCVTHIWGDARTHSGVPIGHGRRWIGRTFETGSAEEHARREWYYRPAAVLACFLAVASTIAPALT